MPPRSRKKSASRAIPSFSLGAETGLTETINAQFYGDNLQDAIEGLCKQAGIGYRIAFDRSVPGFVFTLYEGKNRTSSQSVNPRVIFSPDFDNLLSTEYVRSSEKFRNVAQVAGEGEGTAKKIVTVGTASGLARYETRIDGSSASTNSDEFDLATYMRLLTQKGREELAKLATTEAVSGSVTQTQFRIGIDYDLGDIVEIANEYGISMSTRVTEVVESWSDTGYTILPTFAEV